jgi:hypothetical protein
MCRDSVMFSTESCKLAVTAVLHASRWLVQCMQLHSAGILQACTLILASHKVLDGFVSSAHENSRASVLLRNRKVCMYM